MTTINVPVRSKKRRQLQLIWTNALGQSFTVSFDAHVDETHTLPSMIAVHPIEKGASAVDHIRPEPDQLSFVGYITNTPIILPQDFADGTRPVQVQIDGVQRTIGNTIGRVVPIAGALLAPIPLGPKTKLGNFLGFDTEFDRVQGVFDALRKVREDGSLLTCITKLHQYENMALASLEIRRSAELGDSAQFSVSLVEVRLGRTDSVEVPALPIARVSKGPKAPAQVDEPADESESVTRKFLSAIGLGL